MNLEPDELLQGMSREQKKGLFTTLAATLFPEFSEIEKKKLLQKIISGKVPEPEVIGMVEH